MSVSLLPQTSQILADLDRLEAGDWSRPLLHRLLEVDGEDQERLFQRAREVRERAGADRVTLRGVIEISNHCQKSCDYCAMRSPNHGLDRYRMDVADVLEIADQLVQHRIPILFLQAGQDPQSDALVEEVIPLSLIHI